MTQHLLITKKPRQRGITLIEVLISVFIVSFAVVGAAALQVNSLKNSMAMEYRAQASYLANDMFERMRAADRVGQALSGYDSDSPAANSTLAGQDLAEWASLVSSTLPSGAASIEVTVDSVESVRLTFTWQQRSPYAQGGGEQITFAIEAVI